MANKIIENNRVAKDRALFKRARLCMDCEETRYEGGEC